MKHFSKHVFYLPYATIYTSIEDYELREINEKENVVTLDMSLRLMWMDIGIFTFSPKYFTEHNRVEEQEGYEVSNEAVKAIWKPELYVHHVSDYKAFKDSLQIVGVRIKRANHFDGDHCIVGPMVIYEIEVKVSFYCKFDLSNYPMDKSHCKFRFGGKGLTTAFKLDQTGFMSQNHKNIQFMDIMFNISSSEDDPGIETKRSLGLDISMQRTLGPYVLKYYIPCITIVIISQISFVIPLDALPGRVCLLVTQFLTLTSLFIQQMVSELLCICYYQILNIF